MACKHLRSIAMTMIAALTALLTGCGGEGFSSLQGNLGGDIANGYNTPISSQGRAGDIGSALVGGSYHMIETSFQLPSVPGDPFDYEKVNVQVTLRKPGGGTVDVPAFYDGDKLWRARYTPLIPGQYSVVTVRLNREIAHEEKLTPKEWSVNGEQEPGFVRIDRSDHSRFMFDDGSRYYPIGHNQAWRGDQQLDFPDMFAKMHTAGENWSRVWMTHWDGKNLDWSRDEKASKPGEIDLTVAKRWDDIVQGAEKNDIYFQMTLQHHGQYSTTVNSNWDSNPYNAKNGGFLQSAQSFFTDNTARAYTKRKLYYILARWGYSPNIMAFELFNEVQFTDGIRNKRADDVALWHREMSLFLKQYDINRHLITSSSADAIPLDSPIWQTVDYVQVHTYPSDLITALGGADPGGKKLDKPIFVGEFGPDNLNDAGGTGLHDGLWAGMMRGPSGAPEYWDWEVVEKNNLYSQFKSASSFVTASALPQHGGTVGVDLPIETEAHADLKFSPGGGFEAAKESDFVIGSSGPPVGMARYPSYFQGTAHHDMMGQPLTLHISCPQAATFTVNVSQVAAAGAHLKVRVDGTEAEQDYPPAEKDYSPLADHRSLQVKVTQGSHTVTVENLGKDWAKIGSFTLSNYAPALGTVARASHDYLVAWIYHRMNVDAPADQTSDLKAATGKLTLPALRSGRYRAAWWDTRKGQLIEETDIRFANSKEAVTLTTPPVTRDVALYLTRLSEKLEKEKTGGRVPGTRPNQPGSGSAPGATPAGAAQSGGTAQPGSTSTPGNLPASPPG